MVFARRPARAHRRASSTSTGTATGTATASACSLLDSVYYATVTLSTTGYGDITPITPGARLVNILLITPLRIMFLLVLIGTTLEALTARSREEFRIRRWRSRVRQHVIVCGYGTKGRSAIRSLQALGTPLDKIVVVDPEPRAIDEANSLGLTGIVGDAGRTEVLRRASVERARAVIVAANRDDAAVLITLTVRQLNPTVPITTSVREEENANLLRQSGADTVITTSATSGRLLGPVDRRPARGRRRRGPRDRRPGPRPAPAHRSTASEVGLGPALAARHRPVGHPRRPHAALRRPADRRRSSPATSSSSSAAITECSVVPSGPGGSAQARRTAQRAMGDGSDDESEPRTGGLTPDG